MTWSAFFSPVEFAEDSTSESPLHSGRGDRWMEIFVQDDVQDQMNVQCPLSQ